MADIPYEGTVFGANSVIGHLIGMAVPVEVWKSSEVTLQRMVRRSSSSTYTYLVRVPASGREDARPFLL